MRGGDNRPHLILFCALLDARSDAQRFDQRRQASNQLVGGIVADRDHDRQRHAAFASGAKGAAHNGIHRRVEIGVRHDDSVVLRRAECLHAFAVGAGGFIDVLSDAGRANEAHRRDARIFIELLGVFVGRVHHVKHAVRQACFFQQLRHTHRCGRIERRRLKHKGVTAGQRDREHPQRHHCREVKRGNTRNHSHRLHQRVAVNACAYVCRVFALNQMRNAAGELYHFKPARQLALRIRPHFAVFRDNQFSQLVAVLLHQRLEVKQNARAAQRRSFRPGGEGVMRHFNRFGDFCAGALR